METHKEWLLRVTGDSLRGVARAIGVNQGNFPGRVAKGLSADLVLDIASAYQLDPIQALEDTGFLTAQDSREHTQRMVQAVIDSLSAIDPNGSATTPFLRVQDALQNDYQLVADSSPDEDKESDE